MSTACAGSLLARLAQVPDPRGRKGRRHPLSAMLAAIVSGLLCGTTGYTGLIEWLQDLPVDFWHKLGFTRRPPKLDCFRDLLMKLDTEALDRVLREWVLEFFPHAQDELLAVLSLDGKTLCGSARVLKKGVHLLSLVVHGSGVVLAQNRVDEKTNEHKGALELLEKVLLKDVVIVGDAAFCHRDLCQQIVKAEGHYVLAVKENQPTLYREISLEFQAAKAAFSPLHPA
jgi:DDE_Tnp_1-associated/Transposase DDE domain